MSKVTVLYNPHSGNGRGEKEAQNVRAFYPNDELEFIDVTINDHRAILKKAGDNKILICGGDGTLNHFINEVDTDNLSNEVYYYPTGSGNDFINDLNRTAADGPVKINEYIVNLPVCKVNNKEYKFINGIGYGIDGYCCEEGDRIRVTSNKRVNYTSIALKGLMYKYKPTNAKVTADGVTKEYKGVWIAPTMNGRYYGGGMMPAPDQKRLEEDKHVTNMVFYGTGKLKTILIFPTIFKGKHLKYTKNASIARCKNVKVEFDRPVALQVDGETILDVTSYEVSVK